MQNKHATTLGSHCMHTCMHLTKISRLNCLCCSCWLIQFNSLGNLSNRIILLPAFFLSVIVVDGVASVLSLYLLFFQFLLSFWSKQQYITTMQMAMPVAQLLRKIAICILHCTICAFSPSASAFSCVSFLVSLSRQPTQMTKTASLLFHFCLIAFYYFNLNKTLVARFDLFCFLCSICF